MLSALSLTDVSNISISAVPVYADEISNRDRYTFGDFYREPSSVPEVLLQQAPVLSQKIALKANRWKGLAHAVSRWRLDKAFNLGASQEPAQALGKNIKLEPIQDPVQTVLGVSMSEVLEYSSMAIYSLIFIIKMVIFLQMQRRLEDF